MSDSVLFQNESVTVSKNAFVANGEKFDLASISAVNHSTIDPNLGLPTLCLLSGPFLILVFEDVFILLGGLLIALGLFAILTAKTLYSVVIHTSDGLHQALTSENVQEIETVINALNNAIISVKS